MVIYMCVRDIDFVIGFLNSFDSMVFFGFHFIPYNIRGAVVLVIVWKLDLQLPVQSVPITIKIVSSNPVHGEVYSIQYYVIKFDRSVIFSEYSCFLHLMILSATI